MHCPVVKAALFPLNVHAAACLGAGSKAFCARGTSLVVLCAAVEGREPKMLCCMALDLEEHKHAFNLHLTTLMFGTQVFNLSMGNSFISFCNSCLNNGLSRAISALHTKPPSIPSGQSLFLQCRRERSIGVSMMGSAYISRAQIEMPTCER